MMECRVMGPQDRPAVHRLWRRVYGDEEQFVDACLDIFAGEGNVFVAGEEVVAMLLAVPCAAKGRPGAYFYALATVPEQRGLGVMTRLMDYAEAELQARGAQFAVLIPATQSLFSYYRARGFADTLGFRALRLEAADLAGRCAVPVDAKISQVSAESYAKLRKKLLGAQNIGFAGERFAMVWGEVAAQGGRVALTSRAAAVYYLREGRLGVAELLAPSDEEAGGLLAWLCRETGCGEALVTLPEGGGLFARQGSAQPAAQLKKLDAAFEARGLYLRFAIDEVFGKDYETLAPGGSV